MSTGHITWGVTYPEDLAYTTSIPKLNISNIATIEEAFDISSELVGQGYTKEELKVVRHIGYMHSEQITLKDLEYYDTNPHIETIEDIFEQYCETIY